MSEENDRLTSKINDIEKFGKKARGKGELLKYLGGARISALQTILAKCYECMGYYIDGKNDCKVPLCPNYPKMPYRGKEEEREVKGYG